MMRGILKWIFVVTCFSSSTTLFAVGQFPQYMFDDAEMSVQEHYNDMLEMLKTENWKGVHRRATIIIDHFTDSPFIGEVRYQNGVALYKLKRYEEANLAFTDYLQKTPHVKHFESAIDLKFSIAEKFRTGTRAHLFGVKKFPRVLSGKEQSLEIYEEVIASLPNHDLAARSLYGKGEILAKIHDYRESIDTFQTLIRRFPKHACTPDSYVQIAKIYLAQCQREFPDPDALDLAEINLRKFRLNFPGEKRLELAYNYLHDMKEIFAKDLLEIADFYHRVKKKDAEKIYLSYLIDKYPDTETACEVCELMMDVEGRTTELRDLGSKEKAVALYLRTQEKSLIDIDNQAEEPAEIVSKINPKQKKVDAFLDMQHQLQEYELAKKEKNEDSATETVR